MAALTTQTEIQAHHLLFEWLQRLEQFCDALSIGCHHGQHTPFRGCRQFHQIAVAAASTDMLMSANRPPVPCCVSWSRSAAATVRSRWRGLNPKQQEQRKQIRELQDKVSLLA